MSAQITTVIPTYRRPRLLSRAIRSVLSQSYPHLEVHVYDNASGDGTPQVVAELAKRDPRVKYHCHNCNIGMMENFAYGISHVETPFFSILSDDDFLFPDFFATATEALAEHRSATFFFGGLLFFDGGQVVAAPVETWNIEGRVDSPTIFRALSTGAWITWTSSLLRTERVIATGGFRPELGYGSDVELLLRPVVRSAAIVSRKPCAVMNLHHGSASAADHGQEYSSDKILTLFESVENEIARARNEGALWPEQACSMQRMIRDGLEWRLFRRAFVLLAQEYRDSAVEVAETLHVRCGKPSLAAVVHLVAGANPIGLAVRAWLRLLRSARRTLTRRTRDRRYEQYARLVERARNDLECEDSEPLRNTALSVA